MFETNQVTTRTRFTNTNDSIQWYRIESELLYWLNLEWSRSIQFPLLLRSPENVARLSAPVTCLSIVIHRSVDRHEEFFDPFFHRSLDPQVSPSSRFGGGRAPASFLDPSFLFPGNFDRRLSTIAPVMAARHEYIYIYISRRDRNQVWFTWRARAWSARSVGSRYSVSERGVPRENFGIEGVSTIDSAAKRRSVVCARTRHDAFEAAVPLNTRPTISKYGARAFMERWNKSGFARDPRMIIGRTRSGENSPTGQGSFTAN